MTAQPADGDWVLHAACRGLPTSAFYPTTGEDHRPAARVCATCPVTAHCLKDLWSQPVAHWHGVWAGRTAKQWLEQLKAHRRRGETLDEARARIRALM